MHYFINKIYLCFIVVCLSSCYFEYEKEININVGAVCECYSVESVKSDMNSALNKCIHEDIALINETASEFEISNEEITEIEKEIMSKITIGLTKQCDLFKNDMYNLSAIKFTKIDLDTSLALIEEYESGNDIESVEVEKVIIAYFKTGERGKAFDLINSQLIENPVSNYFLWMKSVFKNIEGDDKEALRAINEAIRVSQDATSKFALGLYRNSILVGENGNVFIDVVINNKKEVSIN